MLSTYYRRSAALLVVFAIMLLPSLANASGISNPGEGKTVSFNLAWVPGGGVGFIVRGTVNHSSIHGGAWFGERTNGVLGFGVTADHDMGDAELNGELGMSVVFKRHDVFGRNFVPYWRLGAAYTGAGDGYRYGLGVTHYGFALNRGLEGEAMLDFEIGRDGRKEPAVVIQDEGMTQIDPPNLCEDEECPR